MPRLVWQVPIDDRSFEAFVVTHIPVTGNKAERVHELRSQMRQDGRSVGRQDLGQRSVPGSCASATSRCRMFYKLIQVEDYVAQVGQGQTPGPF